MKGEPPKQALNSSFIGPTVLSSDLTRRRASAEEKTCLRVSASPREIPCVAALPFIVSLVALWLAGCNKETPPVLAGGKPIEHWVAASRDPNEKVRKQAIQKLGNAGNSDPAVLPVLVAALKDASPGIRREAIIAIVKYGPGAEQAIDALKTVASTDADPRIRGYAAQAVTILNRS
jgi:hypothetical protein